MRRGALPRAEGLAKTDRATKQGLHEENLKALGTIPDQGDVRRLEDRRNQNFRDTKASVAGRPRFPMGGKVFPRVLIVPPPSPGGGGLLRPGDHADVSIVLSVPRVQKRKLWNRWG